MIDIEIGRQRADECYWVKILNGYENIDSNIFFEIIKKVK